MCEQHDALPTADVDRLLIESERASSNGHGVAAYSVHVLKLQLQETPMPGREALMYTMMTMIFRRKVVASLDRHAIGPHHSIHMEPGHIELVAEEKRPPRRAAKRTRPVQLASGDTELFRRLDEYRLLTCEQLGVLLGRDPKRINRRLLKLVENGYVKCRPVRGAKYMYSIGTNGLSVLLDHGLISEDAAGWRLREHELKDTTLAHEAMIADVHLMFELASRESHLKLCEWRQGKDLMHTIDDAYEKLTVEPDAFFGLEDTRLASEQNLYYFFLEAHRSSMANAAREGSRRFHDKFRKYVRYFEARGHAAKYGKQNIRVVTITETTRRRDSLASDAARPEFVPEKWRKAFFFGSREDFSIANAAPILGTTFLRAGKPALRPLVTDKTAG